MKLFLECSMGASGDMLMAALYELLPDKSLFREKMECLGLTGVTFEFTESVKCGIKGTHITVRVDGIEEISDDVKTGHDDHDHHRDYDRHHDHDHDFTGHHHHEHEHEHHHEHEHDHEHEHHHKHEHDHEHEHHHKHYSFKEILELIRSLNLPALVKENALGVYKILGEAESTVHGIPLDEIHLHETGRLDAVADIVGCCLLIEMLGVTDIKASPVHVGFGSVRCEHGILPVPAPATAEILKGVPTYSGSIEGELCTPTGAALLKHFVKEFGKTPQMTVEKIGNGMGKKDFKAANCLRVFLYDDALPAESNNEIIYEISCNLDDMPPEAIGAAFDVLFENGALDVYTTPILMKKNRPAVMLSCLCSKEKRNEIAQVMLKHTTTLGVRMTPFERIILERDVETVQTKFGDIRIKRAKGFGIEKTKPEYDDVLAAAKAHDVPFTTVHIAATKASGDPVLSGE